MSVRNALLAASAAVSVAAFGTTVMAQDYPNKPVEIIVSFSPGGATDILARVIADELSEIYDNPFIVQNRPGAGGTLGTTMASRADPDGYTIFLGQVSSHGVAPPLYGDRIEYDPIADFTPVALISASPQVMVVRTESEIESVDDFIAKTKEQDLIYASSGIGTTVHLSGELFNNMAGTDLIHVPYQGSGPAVSALLSGEVDVLFDDLPSSMSHIRAGTLRPLAVTVAEANPSIPDVPTLSDVGSDYGLGGFDASAWFVIAGPAGLPDEVVTSLNTSLNTMLEGESMQKFLSDNGAVPMGGTPEDAAAHIEAELEKWAAVIKAGDIKLE
ncbi:Bug family tripartite tricarboxylate transporter substrate binding protein [Roseovarius sp. S1116L3]|uniref:Bug family tripartite tricarboxylate transporter substrate binding protein n=1 Tax=Roseovarius roseus TaxID=3342636 RepID=UPI00372A4BB1